MPAGVPVRGGSGHLLAELARNDGVGDRGTVPEGEDLVRQGRDREGVRLRKRDRVAADDDPGGQQAAGDSLGVEEDAPFLRAEFEELQVGEFGDLERVGERAGIGADDLADVPARARCQVDRVAAVTVIVAEDDPAR